MRTTLDLPDETFRQLKAQAALSGLKLKELVTQLIQRGLAAGVPATAAPLVPVSPPIAIERVAGSPLTPALTNAQLQALLDDQDVAQVQRVRQQPSAASK
jgi:hypothetical protein